MTALNSQKKTHTPAVARKVLYKLTSSTSLMSSQHPLFPHRGQRLCDVLCLEWYLYLGGPSLFEGLERLLWNTHAIFHAHQ